MADRSLPDTPTGPTTERPDAPDLSPDQAGRPAGGNQVENGPQRTPGRPGQHQQAEHSDFDETAAESVIDALNTDWRIQKGSDPGSPLAGLLAAGAAANGAVDRAGYQRFLDGSEQRWASIDELEERYGSFEGALAAAGMT
jgi:hypothetical protein